MKTKNNKLLTLLTVLTLFAIPLSLFSQHLINQSTGVVKNAGVIKFKADGGQLQNEASANSDAAIINGYKVGEAPNSGTIEFSATMAAAYTMFAGTNPIGAASASRIQGWVRFSGAGNQYIQSAYFASLALSGAGTKNYGASQVFVDSIYTVTGGDRDYGTGRFTYDGPAGGLNDQTIVPESGSVGGNNIYNELYFMDGGTKTLLANTTANVETEINIDNLAIVKIQGTMEAVQNATVTTAASGTAKTTGLLLLDGTGTAAQDGFFITNDGAGNLDGDIFIYNGGTYLVNGTGLQTFSGNVTVGEDVASAASSGSISISAGAGHKATFDGAGGATGVFELANENGAIVVGDQAEAEFAGALGSFINSDPYSTGPRSNMQFHVNSTAHYTNAAQIVGTKTGYPYGNLVIDNTVGGGTLAPEGATGNNGIDVYVAGNFTLDDRLLLMDNDADPTNGSQVLVMKDDAKTVTYTDDSDGGTEEVVGAFKRIKTGSYSAGTALTFNNRMTQVTLNDNIAHVSDFSVYMYPNTAPVNAVPTPSDYTVNYDVKRRTLLKYTETGQGWTFKFQLGYLSTELPAGFFGDNTMMNTLRFRKYVNGQASEKLATGIALGRENTEVAGNDNLLYVNLSGITTNPSASLTSAIIGDGVSATPWNEVFLRGGPTWFITIRNGRWSNPATWDEGVQPGPNDLCLVRHTVHAGWVRATDNYQVNEDVHLASFGTDESELASYIQVFGGTVNGVDYDGTLMFGSIDNGAAAPNNDNTKTMVNPTWGLRSTAFTGTWTSPFTAQSNTQDAAVSAGDIYITALRGTPGTNLPTNYATATQDGYSATVGMVGGVVNFLGSDLTVPAEFTNHGWIVNGGVINVGP